MQKAKQFIGFGVLLWAILVVASLVLRVYETGNSPLFESVKFVVLASASVLLTALYLRQVKTASSLQGLGVGVSWMLVVIVLDLILYMLGLFNLGLDDYFSDVVSSYVVIPITTTIAAYFLQAKKS